MKISKKIKQNITKTTDKEWCATGCYCIQYVFLTHPDTSITLTLPQYLCNLWHKRMIISTGRINQATILWSSTQGSYALALTHCLLPKLESQISQLVLLGVNWQQPLFEVVYKKHMDFTDFYSHTYNDFCFLSIKSEKFAKKKKKKWRSGEQSAFIIQFTIVLTGMLDFPGPEMHQLRLLESY